MNEIQEATGIIARLIPFFTLCLSIRYVNLKQKYRYRQVLMPIAALIFSILISFRVDGIAENSVRLLRFIQSWIPVLRKFEIDTWAVLIANTIIVTIYLGYKASVLKILDCIWKKMETIFRLKRHFFYEYSEKQEAVVLKKKWGQLKNIYNTMFFGAVIIATAILFLSYEFSDLTCFHYYRPYPVIAVITLEAVMAYFSGLTENEIEEKKEKEEPFSHNKNVNFTELKEQYHRVFSDVEIGEYEVSWSNSKEEKTKIESMIGELEKSKNNQDKALAAYLKQETENGRTIESNYIMSICDMLRGKSVIFANPFYQDLTMEICFTLNMALLRQGKGLVITGRYEMEQELKEWLQNGFFQVTHVPSFWKIDKMERKIVEGDIAILSAKELYNVEMLELNRKFLEQVSFVLILEPSMLIAQGQIGLSILSDMLGTEREKPVYCACDRNVEGLVDALSHILKVSLTEVRATVPTAKDSTVMFWNADCGNINKRIFTNFVTYMGEGTALAAIALKLGAKVVSWRSDTLFPVWDIRWITGLYYSAICQYIKCAVDQEALFKALQFSRNLWNLPRTDITFNIIEDESYNLFEIGRQFSTRGKEKSFTNVLSSNYMLRGYMCCNEKIFMNDPRAVPQISADYARTKRNAVLQMIIMMSNYPVGSTSLERIFAQVGIFEPVTCDSLNALIQEYYDVRQYRQIVKIHKKGEKTVKNNTIVAENYYVIQNDEFVRNYAVELQNAYYVAEDDMEKNQEEKRHYLGSRLMGHIYQSFIPGQFCTLAGKYYEVLSIVRGNSELRNAVIVRRAGEHITSRKYYRQIRTWNVETAVWNQSDDVGHRQVNGIDIYTGFANLCVSTSGYLQLSDYHDICSAVKVEVSDIPKRNYQKKQSLKIVLPKASDEIRITIAIMLNEIFRSTYSNMTDYLAAVTPGTNESKDIPEGVLQGLTGEFDESAIYIFEDSQIDMGLLTSVERNLTRFFELIYDYCDWLIEGQQEEQYPDNSSEDESVENEAEESQIYAHTFEGDSGEEDVTKNEENDTQEAQLCYLKFGYSEYSRMVQVEQTGQYLKSLGFDQNAYTATRKKKIKICLDGKGHMCDFCGRELSNDSYQVLKDGRERCSKCSETVLHTLEEYEKLFEKVFHDMEIYYGIKLNPKIRVKVVDTSVVQRAFKKKWRPTSGHDSRVIGYANSQGTKIVLENGAPRPKLVETIVHELTHIWQFDNWNYRELHKRYPTDEGMRDVEEGMAQWTCIQYMYLSGYEEYMDARLPLELNRDDEYGRGLRMFVKRYPLQKKRSLWGNTPFKNPDNPV